MENIFLDDELDLFSEQDKIDEDLVLIKGGFNIDFTMNLYDNP